MQEEDQYNPEYYKKYSIQVTDAIESWGLSFVKGNVIKYIVRAGKKTEEPIIDLKKALWYLEKEISKYEREEQKNTSKFNKTYLRPTFKT